MSENNDLLQDDLDEIRMMYNHSGVSKSQLAHWYQIGLYEVNLILDHNYHIEKESHMTTIDNNSLFALLRDVRNQSLTVEDAMERIQALSKSEMKEEVQDGLSPQELAQAVSESATEASKEQQEALEEAGQESAEAKDTPIEIVPEEKPEEEETEKKPAPKKRSKR